ncbi:hypothetical protein WJX73_003222 [Symbiochloris irregularis]|uniref:C2 domain-containing protein n=1 Tax=Symbiochloris irregularis TaxID=706552 RepID=A0AAW1PVR3_9CHLO
MQARLPLAHLTGQPCTRHLPWQSLLSPERRVCSYSTGPTSKRRRLGRAPQASNEGPSVIAEDFNLALAATLGACSFEAYNSPYSMYGLKEVDDNHSETVYMNKAFLNRVVRGVLQVHIRRAEGLSTHKNEKGKTVDLHPQVMVQVGPSCGWSSAQTATTDPIYGETMYLFVRDPEKESLRVSLQHCTSKPDQKQGELAWAELDDISTLCDGRSREVDVQVEGEDGFKGTVYLGLEFLEHTEDGTLLDDLSIRAAGQMMSDDWGWELPEEDWWVNTEYEWRSHLVKTDAPPMLELEDKDHALDITGEPAGSGEPLDREPWDMWSSLRKAIITRKLTSSFEPLAFLAHCPTDTEGWVFVNDNHEIVVAFRGTSSPADMIKDAVFDLAAFSPGNRPKSKGPEEVAEEVSDEDLEKGGMGGFLKFAEMIDSIPLVPQLGKLVSRVFSGGSGRTSTVQGKPPLTGWAKAQALMVYSAEHNECWVHNGFLQSYVAVSKPLVRLLEEIMDMKDDEPWHIYCTGHSMGGSLATLAAYELSAIDYKTAPKPKITVYTFGSPRVGNIPFAEDYDQQVPDTWRVANQNDIVTRIPSLLGYRHVGTEVRLTQEGTVRVSKISDDQVREGATMSDVWPRIKEGLTGSDDKLKKEFRELVKGEWEISQSLIRGQAIQEHMEDKYHDMLKACVELGGDECKAKFAEVDEALKA